MENIKIHSFNTKIYQDDVSNGTLEKEIESLLYAETQKGVSEERKYEKFLSPLLHYIVYSNLIDGALDNKIKASLQLFLQIHRTYLLSSQKEREILNFRLGNIDVCAIVVCREFKVREWWERLVKWSVICRATKAISFCVNFPIFQYITISEVRAMPEQFQVDLDWTLHEIAYQSELKLLNAIIVNDKNEVKERLNNLEAAITQLQDSRGFNYHWKVTASFKYNLIKAIIENDIESFNSYLLQAIEYHKEHWGADVKEGKFIRKNDFSGHFSLDLTFIMSLAYENNMKIKVFSDYTPSKLVEGNFSVDLDTPLEFYWKPTEENLDWDQFF